VASISRKQQRHDPLSLRAVYGLSHALSVSGWGWFPPQNIKELGIPELVSKVQDSIKAKATALVEATGLPVQELLAQVRLCHYRFCCLKFVAKSQTKIAFELKPVGLTGSGKTAHCWRRARPRGCWTL
jgi:hypothetical protein